MEASIVELRYKMKDILQALDRNESVKIFYHGKEKGILHPLHKTNRKKVAESPLFGMFKDEKKSVNEIMQELRRARHTDI